MIQALFKYKHLWLILTSWIVAGVLFQPAAYVLVLGSAILFFIKGRYIELFIGFLFILLLSDHVHHGVDDPTIFAKDLKSIYLLLLGLVIWRNRKEFDLNNAIFIVLIPFFLLAFISLTWAINLPVGFQKTLSYTLLYFIVPIFIVNLFKSKREEFLLILLNYFVLIFLIGIILKFTFPSVIDLIGGRYRGLLGNPNGLGILIVQVILLFSIIKSYKLITITKNQTRFFYALVIISLLLSGSRNGMISIILFLILVRVFKVHFLVGVFILLLTFYVYQTVSIDPVALIRYAGMEEYFRIQTIETGSGRFIAWQFAWRQLQDYYFMGGGFGQDEQIMRPNYAFLERLGHSGGVHNSYISMWMDTGLIGVILYFSAMLTLIWKAAKNSNLAWPFFFTILFNITYESWLVGSLNPFTVMFLCSLTLLVMKERFLPTSRYNTDTSPSSKVSITRGPASSE